MNGASWIQRYIKGNKTPEFSAALQDLVVNGLICNIPDCTPVIQQTMDTVSSLYSIGSSVRIQVHRMLPLTNRHSSFLAMVHLAVDRPSIPCVWGIRDRVERSLAVRRLFFIFHLKQFSILVMYNGGSHIPCKLRDGFTSFCLEFYQELITNFENTSPRAALLSVLEYPVQHTWYESAFTAVTFMMIPGISEKILITSSCFLSYFCTVTYWNMSYFIINYFIFIYT